MEFTTDIPDLKRVLMSGLKSWHDNLGSLRVSSDYADDRGYERGRYKLYCLTSDIEGNIHVC